MSFEFRPCELEMDYGAYIKFLIRHHDELNLPYSFAMKLSFLSSPLMMGKAMLVMQEEPYQIVGAAGFVYGTGANDYEDRHVCQVEVAFIRKEYRNTCLFARGLQALLEQMKAGNPNVELVQFWVPAEHRGLDKLFSKFAERVGTTGSTGDSLALYQVTYDKLDNYCRRCDRVARV